jgi:hypothetical protein
MNLDGNLFNESHRRKNCWKVGGGLGSLSVLQIEMDDSRADSGVTVFIRELKPVFATVMHNAGIDSIWWVRCREEIQIC